MEQIKLSTLEWIETKNIEPNETDWVLGAWKQEDGWIYRSCMREIEHDGMEHYHTPGVHERPTEADDHRGNTRFLVPHDGHTGLIVRREHGTRTS